MKKIFAALISMILGCSMLFAFVGCIDREEAEVEEEVSTQSTFFNIEEAYANELISKNALKSIAYYYNHETGAADFPLILKTPERLSEETIRKIKQAFYDKATDREPEATVDDVGIAGYYGTYNGYVVIDIGASCVSGMGGDPLYYPEYVIDDVVFYSYTPLQVWKEADI